MARARRDKDQAVAGDGHIFIVFCVPSKNDAGAFRLAVVVSILEHPNPICGWTLITGWPKVRMALDDQDTAVMVDRDSCGRDDLGLREEAMQLEHQPRI